MNMNDLKNSKASVSTVTINRNEFDQPTENIYEAISITAKRAIQINSEIKKELLENLPLEFTLQYVKDLAEKDESKDFKSIIRNPTYKKEDKIDVINKISQHYNINILLKNFLCFLATKRRLFFISPKYKQ